MTAKVRIFAGRQQQAGSESGETGLNGVPVTAICPSIIGVAEPDAYARIRIYIGVAQYCAGAIFPEYTPKNKWKLKKYNKALGHSKTIPYFCTRKRGGNLLREWRDSSAG